MSTCNRLASNPCEKGAAPAELKNFITESREIQTCFANFNETGFTCNQKQNEEYFNKHAMMKDVKGLRELKEGLEFIQFHLETIHTICRQENTSDRVELSLVLICCFLKREKKCQNLIVLKLTTGNTFKILSVHNNGSPKAYPNWKDFLDKADFPESLLCFPRDGEYKYIEKELSLEYVNHSRPNQESGRFWNKSREHWNEALLNGLLMALKLFIDYLPDIIRFIKFILGICSGRGGLTLDKELLELGNGCAKLCSSFCLSKDEIGFRMALKLK